MDRRDAFQVVLITIAVGYAGVSVGAMAAGVNGTASDCTGPWRRWEYIVPAFRLGCWLQEVP